MEQSHEDSRAEGCRYGGSGGWDGNPSTGTRRRQQQPRIAMGGDGSGRESVLGLVSEVKKETLGDEDVGFELVAGVLEVLSKLDSLL